MKIPSLLLSLSLLGVLAACGQPVPQDKAVYVGKWQETSMYLLITQDGPAKYQRLKNGAATSIDGPLKGFNGSNFDVGIGPMATIFVASKPPYRDGTMWKMVVDGQELTRTD